MNLSAICDLAMVVLAEPCGWRRCDARTWQSGSPRRPSTLKIETLKDYSPARRVARATCDKPLQRCVSTPNIGRKQVVEDEEEDPEVISLDGCDLFPKRTTNVTFQETVEVYHFEPVDPELLRKVSQRSLEDLTINQRVAEMARNHEKIVAQMSACYNFVCSMMIGPRFGNFGTIQ